MARWSEGGWKTSWWEREEWKKLLRTARNRRILHVPMEWINEWIITLDSVPSCCYMVFIYKPSQQRVSILLCNLVNCLCEMELLGGYPATWNIISMGNVGVDLCSFVHCAITWHTSELWWSKTDLAYLLSVTLLACCLCLRGMLFQFLRFPHQLWWFRFPGITLHQLIDCYWCFGGVCCLHLQGLANREDEMGA
jgi:hypothetical protein